MSTFVLVHGSWTGGWLWSRVAPLLERQGHRVLTPDLLGLGARRHLATPATGLSSHVDDLVALLGCEQGQDVVLVGHSYAGMLLSDVTVRSPRAVNQLIYLDAFLPEPGECAFDLAPNARRRFEDSAVGDGWLVAPPDYRRYGIHSDHDLGWLEASSAPMPMRTHMEPATAAIPADLPVTYIGCTAYEGMRSMFARAGRWGLARQGWEDVGHMAMVSHSHRLARSLDQLARRLDK